jgi:hypothetical protein
MRPDAGEIPLLAPDPEHQRDQTATAATTNWYALAYQLPKKTQDAHRAKRQRVYRVRGLT